MIRGARFVAAALVWAITRRLGSRTLRGGQELTLEELGCPPAGVCLICGYGTDGEDTDLCEGCLTPSNEAALEAVRRAGFEAWDRYYAPPLEQQDRS